MSHREVVLILGLSEAACCVAALTAIFIARQWRDYSLLCALLFSKALANTVLAAIFCANRPEKFYTAYFTTYWAGYAVEALLTLGIIVSIYRLAMRPLQGLHSLGMLVFKWVAAISAVITISVALSSHTAGNAFIMKVVSQLLQTQSVLTLCLLAFVTMAIKPMGLSYKSRIFGVSLGLGMMAAMQLVQAAWFAPSKSTAHTLSYISSGVICATLLMWTAYFALPEPKRRMVLLPTTSPFLRWNQISLALGSNPGFVAVDGLNPEMLAPAELEVIRRASRMISKDVAQMPANTAAATRLAPQSTENVYPIRTASLMKHFQASSFL